MRFVSLFAATVWLSSCALMTGPTLGRENLKFEAEKVQDFAENPVISVTGSDEQISIEGGLWTPCAGFTLDAEATTDGSVIILRVIADANSPDRGCRRAVESFRYEATLQGLPSGTYEVRVLHVFKWWESDPNPELTEVKVASVRVG